MMPFIATTANLRIFNLSLISFLGLPHEKEPLMNNGVMIHKKIPSFDLTYVKMETNRDA